MFVVEEQWTKIFLNRFKFTIIARSIPCCWRFLLLAVVVGGCCWQLLLLAVVVVAVVIVGGCWRSMAVVGGQWWLLLLAVVFLSLATTGFPELPSKVLTCS
jgi:hypothetical protein